MATTFEKPCREMCRTCPGSLQESDEVEGGGGERGIYSKPVTNKQQQTINHQQPESKHYSCGRSRCHYCPNILSISDNEITDLIVLPTILEGLVISQYSPWHHLSTVPQYILYIAPPPLHTHMLFKRFSRYSKVVIGCLFILVLISLLKCHFFSFLVLNY